MSKLKNFFLMLFSILFFLIIFIFIFAKSYSKLMFKNISNDFLRLHIVANSDSTSDQIIKYKIRDEIINYLTPQFKNIKTKNEALETLKSEKENINNLAYQIAKENNCNLPISVSIGNFYFPTKKYSEFTLPEGNYDGLKIDIGNAKGQNWWCVIYPSLCIIDSQNFNFSNYSKQILEKNISKDELDIIRNNDEKIDLKIKFKLIELFNF